jgi:hypothetical protein
VRTSRRDRNDSNLVLDSHADAVLPTECGARPGLTAGLMTFFARFLVAIRYR